MCVDYLDTEAAAGRVRREFRTPTVCVKHLFIVQAVVRVLAAVSSDKQAQVLHHHVCEIENETSNITWR